MPRIGRLAPADTALHIMCRGNNKQNIFNRQEDQLRYYFLLNELKEENRITVFHYCLMPNHLHLIVWLSPQSKLAKFMKQVNLTYFNYYRKLYDYCGHLWQGRFKSNIIERDSYLLQCGKYIELNPVRAGIVNAPEDYRFSSYNHYAKNSADSLVTENPLYLGLSESGEKRREQYINFVVDKALINNKSFSKKMFIGSAIFIKKQREYYGIKTEGLSRGRPKKIGKIETSPIFQTGR